MARPEKVAVVEEGTADPDQAQERHRHGDGDQRPVQADGPERQDGRLGRQRSHSSIVGAAVRRSRSGSSPVKVGMDPPWLSPD